MFRQLSLALIAVLALSGGGVALALETTEEFTQAFKLWEANGDLWRFEADYVAWLCEESIEQEPDATIKQLIRDAKARGKCAPVPAFKPQETAPVVAKRRQWTEADRERLFWMMMQAWINEPAYVPTPTPPVEPYRAPLPPYSATFFNNGMGGFYSDNRGNSGTIIDTGVQRNYNFSGPDFQGKR